jgi:RimJ/RimL family protein N-acetyltransferase
MELDLRIPRPLVSDLDFVLRPWLEDDADQVFEACQDPEIRGFIPVPDPYLREHAEAFIAQAGHQLPEGSGIALAIADPRTDAILGSITLHTHDPRHWYIGYWMARPARGRGIASRAVARLSRWAFAEYPDLVRLSLYTMVANMASQRVAEKAGYVREGVLRRWEYHRGEMVDSVMFSLIRGDLASAD